MQAEIDAVGGVVVPKPLRDALGLSAGSTVDISRYGPGLQLVPAGRTARLVEEMPHGSCGRAAPLVRPPSGWAGGSVAVPRYGHQMPRKISIDELRDRMDAVVAAVRAGERLTLTVDGEPVANVVPYAARRSPWVPAAELRRIQREAPADHRLLGDLGNVREGLLDPG